MGLKYEFNPNRPQFEICTLKRLPDNFNMGVVRRANSSLTDSQQAPFDELLSRLSSSGWSLKAVVPEGDGPTQTYVYMFERLLPGGA